ncbi:glycosyltransferase [Mordavella massiliensis]|uniref:glycosyltransferase family 4 protein n=1 Tax=Mordavella massiliensis TaxID=1871024 RepID=UPI00210E410E|nr:glycosyltransferase family 4 protein [Mordavella massiliensis]
MKRVAIVTHNMHQIQGANRVTEKFILGRDYFENSGIKLIGVYSSDGILNPSDYSSKILGGKDTLPSNIRKRKLITLLKKIPLYSSYLGNVWSIRKNLKPDIKAAKLAYSRKDDYDYALLQGFYVAYFYLKERKDTRKKTITIFHTDTDPLEQLLLGMPKIKGTKTEKRLREMLNYVLENSDHIVTICKSEFKYLNEVYGIMSTYITNGIEDFSSIGNFEKMHNTNNRINLICVASVQYRKGQDILVESIRNLSQELRKKIVIHIVGDGPELVNLKRMVNNYGLDDSFVFYGLLQDVKELLCKMDVFILTTRADTTPISIVEALRAGLPVISSNMGEIPHMIKGAGIIVDPEPNKVCIVLEKLIKGEYDIKKMSGNARHNFETRFDLKTMISKYSNIINSN